MTTNDTATEAPTDDDGQEQRHDYSDLAATVAFFDKTEDEEERQNLIYSIALWVIPLGDIKLRIYKNALVTAKAVKPADWNDAVKEARAALSAKARAERDDMFDGLPEAPPAPYYTDDGGLYFNSHFGPVHLANFVPMIADEAM